jgi:hypothetical protein
MSVNGENEQKPHLFLVSCPYVFHHEGKPITYLFAINSKCPPQALEYKNWGIVELVASAETDIVRGGPEVARKDLQSRVPDRDWRITVGNSKGILFQESISEGGWDENALKDIIPRLPSSVLIIEQRLETIFSMACDMAHKSYFLHRHPAPLCVDCVQFGCKGPIQCEQRTPNEKAEIEGGRKFRLV